MLINRNCNGDMVTNAYPSCGQSLEFFKSLKGFLARVAVSPPA